MNDIQQLAQAIQQITPPHPIVPLKHRLMTADDVADYLRVSKRTVLDHYALLDDFPRQIRMPSKAKNGMVRFKAIDIITWAEKL